MKQGNYENCLWVKRQNVLSKLMHFGQYKIHQNGQYSAYNHYIMLLNQLCWQMPHWILTHFLKLIIVTLYVEEFSPRKVSSYLELQTTDNDIFILCFKRKPAKNI